MLDSFESNTASPSRFALQQQHKEKLDFREQIKESVKDTFQACLPCSMHACKQGALMGADVLQISWLCCRV